VRICRPVWRLAGSLLIMSLALLSACSDLPPASAPRSLETDNLAGPRLDLQGQMSIKLQPFGDQPAKGISLGFFFSGNPSSGQLDLMTPLGSQIAQIRWAPEHVWVVDTKGRQDFDSMDALSRARLGEALPLQAMISWLQGRPDPDQAAEAGIEPHTFVQAGWHIDLRQLPDKKLLVERQGSDTQRGATIKVYLDR
jgi:outer membrane lipoprotein LolB